jgi:hypothetical protein
MPCCVSSLRIAAGIGPLISITVNGVEVTGSYSVDRTDRMTGGGTKGARGGPASESVARIILGELYAEANRAKK